MTNLDKSLVSREGHYQNRKLDYCRFFVFFNIDFFEDQIILSLLVLFNFVKQLHHSGPFLGVVAQVNSQLLLLLLQLLDLLLQKLSELLLTPVVFINQSILNEIEDPIQLVSAFLVTPQQLLLHISIISLVLLKGLPVLVESVYLRRQLLFSHEKVLVLLYEAMASMFCNAFHTNVFIVGLAIKFVGLIMELTELMTLPYLFLMAGQLQYYEVFAEHIWLNLGIMFKAAGGTVQELFLFVYDEETLLADSVSAVEIPGVLFLGVVEVIAHGALHRFNIQQLIWYDLSARLTSDLAACNSSNILTYKNSKSKGKQIKRLRQYYGDDKYCLLI